MIMLLGQACAFLSTNGDRKSHTLNMISSMGTYRKARRRYSMSGASFCSVMRTASETSCVSPNYDIAEKNIFMVSKFRRKHIN